MLQKILSFIVIFIVIHFSLASAQINDTVNSSNMNIPNISVDMSNQTSSIPTNQTSSIPTNQTSSIPTNQTNSIPTNQTSSIPTNQTSSIPTNQTNSTSYTFPNSTSVAAIMLTEVIKVDSKSSQNVSVQSLGKLISTHGQSHVERVVSNETNSSLVTYYKTIADPAKGFDNVECSHGLGYTLMTGEYTNGIIPYKVIFLQISMFDNVGHVLATGNGHISDIDVNATKSFNAISRFNGDFISCTIQIDNAIPK